MRSQSPKIDWSELFFSVKGRTSQTPFLIAAASLLLTASLYESMVKGALQYMTILPVYGFLFYCGTCVLAKRLHDRGRSSWYAAFILPALLMVWPSPDGWLDMLGLLVLVWAGIDLSLMPGERGVNRYGSNPVASVTPGEQNQTI
jgi:uncharacterized membrane protein YhaH (DUF805 family)